MIIITNVPDFWFSCDYFEFTILYYNKSNDMIHFSSLKKSFLD